MKNEIIKIHPVLLRLYDGGSYRMHSDDNCLVLQSGEKNDAPQVWLSEAMCKHIQESMNLGLWWRSPKRRNRARSTIPRK